MAGEDCFCVCVTSPPTAQTSQRGMIVVSISASMVKKHRDAEMKMGRLPVHQSHKKGMEVDEWSFDQMLWSSCTDNTRLSKT